MLNIFFKASSAIILLLGGFNYSVSIAQELQPGNDYQNIKIECFQDTSEQKIITKKDNWEKTWSPVEKWVFNQLCQGKKEVRVYDFFLQDKENKTWEVKDINKIIEDFQKKNSSKNAIEYDTINQSIYIKISSKFLETILSDQDLAQKLPNRIVITNGWIKNNEADSKLNLDSVNIDKEVNLKNFLFDTDVTLAKAKISKSIYFDDSIFKKTLAINEAEVKGNIFLRRVKFIVDKDQIKNASDSNKKELIFLNLRGTKVDSSIDLKGLEFKLTSQKSKCNLDEVKNSLSVYLLSASGAKVSKSIILDNANFELCPNNSNFKGIQLDSVNVEQNFELNTDTKFSQLDLKNAQINTLLITISDDLKAYLNQLKLIEILRDRPNKDNSQDFKLEKDGEYLTILKSLQQLIQQQIKIEDVNVKNFQLESVADVNLPPLNKQSEKPQNLSNYQPEDVENPSNDQNLELKICNLQTDGFNYQNINQTAFYILTLCLNSKYIQIQQDVNNTSEKTEDNNQEIIKLFQPLEQAAKAARNIGRYDLERELLYKRKRLEIFIAPSIWEKSILLIQDFMYGFGYHRNKILYFFLLVWSPGFLVAYFQLEYKQKMILNDVCKVVKQEEEDEELRTANMIELNQVVKYIDSIQEVIFCGSFDQKIVNNFNLQVPFIFHKNQGNKDLWFNLSLIVLTPTISIVVSTYISFYGSLVLTVLPCIFYIGYKLLNSNHHLDIKDVKSQIFITFKDENNKDEQLFYTKKVMGMENNDEYSILINSNHDHNQSKQLFSIQKTPKNSVNNTYFRLNLVLDDEDSLVGKNHKDTIIDFVERLDVRNPRNRKIGFCNNLFPEPKLFLVYSQELEKNDNCKILCFYDSDQELFYVEDGKQIVLWRLWKSAIFSIDILLPLVELDPELHQFIFDDSEGLTRGYFILQKILATIIASVLLPVLFITGL
jgi:hypothetical protein